MKRSTAPSFVSFEIISLHLNVSFVFLSANVFFPRMGRDRVFTHTGMALGKPDPMIKDPIIRLEILCELERLLSAPKTNYPIPIHLSTDYFTHSTPFTRPEFLQKVDKGFGYGRFFGTAPLISAALGGVGCSDNRAHIRAGKKYKCRGCSDAMSYGSCDLFLSFVNIVVCEMAQKT